MTRVLMIGIEPTAVDFSAADMSPGVDAAKIEAGNRATREQMAAAGLEAGFCMIQPDPTAEATIAAALEQSWDCVVIGAGVRVPAGNLLLFERVVNAVRSGAPTTPIAFNDSPTNSLVAASRWLSA